MQRVDEYRVGAVRSLWNLTRYFNVLNKDRWTREVDEKLYEVRTIGVRYLLCVECGRKDWKVPLSNSHFWL